MKLVALADDGSVINLPALDTVPAWLKSKRLEKKLSLADLGEVLGVTKQAVFSWESGIASPTTEHLVKLVAAFQEDAAEKPATKATASKMDAVDDLLMSHASNAVVQKKA